MPTAQNTDQTLLAQHRTATVVGLGVTGYSVVRYLLARGLTVSVVDSRKSPPYLKQLQTHYPQVKSQLGTFDGDLVASASLLVVSPGVSLNQAQIDQARHNGVRIVGDIELFMEQNTRPVLAITGSNGKSTVTTLVAQLCAAGGLNALLAGNIGKPVLDALTDNEAYDIAVLELSSFQLENVVQLNADAVAILNISADHMDRYASMGDYVLAKVRILRGAKRIIVPRHDEQLQQITIPQSTIRSFALDEPEDDRQFGLKRESGQRWLVKGDERLIKLRDVPLTGLHNIKNVLAAYALVDDLELPRKAQVKAIKEFHGLAHRIQTVRVRDKVTWVNDSKATNVGATSTALSGLEKAVVWIAGGQSKEADFSELSQAIKPSIKNLILFGEDAAKMAAVLKDALPTHQVETMDEAVELAAKLAKEETVVLLSPACASLDMYESYEQRGNHFIRLVNALGEDGGHDS